MTPEELRDWNEELMRLAGELADAAGGVGFSTREAAHAALRTHLDTLPSQEVQAEATADPLWHDPHAKPEPDPLWYDPKSTHPSPPAQAPEGWRPIETAPKDTQVLLATEFDGPRDWRIKTGYFFSAEDRWVVWGASWRPTRWQPLPVAPGATPPAPGAQEPASTARHPLEAYAESYDLMGQMAQREGREARVSTSTVAIDIRQNMIPATVARRSANPPAIPDSSPELAEDFREYLYRVASQVPMEHAKWARERGEALLSALKAPPSADSKDAARYRWLRRDDVPYAESALFFDMFSGADLDAAIDAAMSPPSHSGPRM